MNRAATILRTAAHYTFPAISFRLIRSRHIHDEVEIDLLPWLAPSDKVAIDVGANVGRYAYPLSQIVSHVHAFEPHPRLARILSAGLPRNTTVRQLAVSDRPGQVTLHIPLTSGRQDEGRASLDTDLDSSNFTSITVDAVTLDSCELGQIGFLKVDVEGHELKVLQGGYRSIRSSRPICLVEAETRHQHDAVPNICAFFRDLGYRGLFVKDRAVFDIAQFSPEMQDPAILLNVLPQTPRRSVPYVNNFIFIPDAAQAELVIEQMKATLKDGH